ncbi:MAG: hypothetical protein PHS99_02075 [Candidatus Marinimicrobia bacterium]|nr:hypothetical protein [Candidatus Neomarinimicrobiota bacterium]
MSALLILAFQNTFPLQTSLSFFNAFSLVFQFDYFNAYFLLCFSFTFFILFLIRKKTSKRLFLWQLLALYSLFLAGNVATVFFAAFIYFIAFFLIEKKTLNVMRYLPLFFILIAYFLFIALQNHASLSIPICEISTIIPASGSVLYIILSAFFIPLLIHFLEFLDEKIPNEEGILEIILSSFAFLFVSYRLTGTMLNPPLALIISFIVIASILCIMAIFLFIKFPSQKSFIPFMILFMISLSMIFMNLRGFPVNPSILRLQKDMVIVFPLYVLLIILFQDVFYTIKDTFTRSVSFVLFIAGLFLNPFSTIGKSFSYIFLTFKMNTLIGFLVFFVFVSFFLLAASFLLQTERKEERWEGGPLQFSHLFFLISLVFVILFEIGMSR